MSISHFIVYLNFTAAIFDYLGRFFTFKSYTKAMVNVSHVTHLLVNVVIFWIYFSDFGAYKEGYSMLMFPFAAFMLFKTAMCIGHYMIQSGIKSNERTRQAVGAIMSNLLVFGIFVGNATSIVFSEIKN